MYIVHTCDYGDIFFSTKVPESSRIGFFFFFFANLSFIVDAGRVVLNFTECCTTIPKLLFEITLAIVRTNRLRVHWTLF